MQLIPGPSSFTSWRKSFRVLRVVLLTLKVCRPGCLDSYEEHIRAFAERFPKYWGVIVKADDLMRSDGWARELQYITTQVEKNGHYAQTPISIPSTLGSV